MNWSRKVRFVITAVMLPAVVMIGTGPPPAVADPVPLGNEQDPAGYVNPFVGTKGGKEAEGNAYAGDTFPGADVPFGMVQWSPDNPLQAKGSGGGGRSYTRDRDGGYAWEEERLRGFSLTHLNGAGCGGGAGDLPFIPYPGQVTVSPAVSPEPYFATFSHDRESASPGYYRVTTDSGITTELTATQRSGMGRFTFPDGHPASLLIDVADSAMGSDDAAVRVDPESRTISGWVSSGHFCRGPNKYKVYFTAEFDQPFSVFGTWRDAAVQPGSTSSGGGNLSHDRFDKQVVTAEGGSGAYVTFDTAKVRTVQVRVGLSYVAEQGARRNAVVEQGDRSFDAITQQARLAWNERLGQVRVDGGTDDQRRTFYTALYHTLLQPNVFSDVDRRYIGFDNQIHYARQDHAQYANFSGWDVYRDQIQLLALLAPHEAGDIAQSLYNQAKQSDGIWDRWSQNNDFMGVMGGDPYHSMIASVYAFGGKDFDADGALDSMVRAANRIQQPGERALERPGLWDYLNLGYHANNVSDMLEETTADFGIAQLARRLGRQDVHREFSARSQYWQNIFNPATGYLQTRLRDGQFLMPLDPGVHHEMYYQEGNAAQYTWMVPYNVRGLFDAMGGDAAAIKRLDTFFTKLNTNPDEPYAFMANEPSFEVPWEYAYAGAAYKTQDVVRRTADELFNPNPDGLPGNDDLGAMSAWYVWAALGMYPEAPGRAELVLASPLFPRITIDRGSGQRIVINAPEASVHNKYVQSLQMNGKPSNRAWVPESLVVNGGTLDYVLASKPNTTWGAATADRPPSFRDGEVPVRGSVGPGLVVAEPGGEPATATVTAEGITGAGTITWTAHPPAGITVSPASGNLTVDRNGKDTQQIRVSAEAGAPASHTAISFSFAGSATRQVPASLGLTVGQRGMLDTAYDNVGVTDDSKGWLGQFANTDLLGGAGFAYSAQALAERGVVPGGQVKADGMTFTWPANAGGGTPDNVVAAGQTIQVPDAPTASRLSFLGAADGGNATGVVKITYTDGTTQTADLGLSDWLGGAEEPQFGNTVVATMPYVNSVFPRYMVRLQRAFTNRLFATAPIALDQGKRVKSVTLPTTTKGGSAHVFGYALS